MPAGVGAYEIEITLARRGAGKLSHTFSVKVTDQFPSPHPRLIATAWIKIADSLRDPEGLEAAALSGEIRAYGLGLEDYFWEDLRDHLAPDMLGEALALAREQNLNLPRAELRFCSTLYAGGGSGPSLWLGDLSIWLSAGSRANRRCVFSIQAGLMGLLAPMSISAPLPHAGMAAITDELNARYTKRVRDFFRDQLGYVESPLA